MKATVTTDTQHTSHIYCLATAAKLWEKAILPGLLRAVDHHEIWRVFCVRPKLYKCICMNAVLYFLICRFVIIFMLSSSSACMPSTARSNITTYSNVVVVGIRGGVCGNSFVLHSHGRRRRVNTGTYVSLAAGTKRRLNKVKMIFSFFFLPHISGVRM